MGTFAVLKTPEIWAHMFCEYLEKSLAGEGKGTHQIVNIGHGEGEGVLAGGV